MILGATWDENEGLLFGVTLRFWDENEGLLFEYSALIPLLQRQVLCVDTTASTPSTLR